MQVDREVMAVLSSATMEGDALRLEGQLDRKLYVQVNKVLEAAGGKWNKKAKAHLFEGGAAERMDQILLTGSIVIPKDEFEYFPTPPAVVELLLTAVDVRDRRVLEPSAGSGHIAFAVQMAGGLVDCIEIRPEGVEELRRSLAGPSNVLLSKVVQADFLAVEPAPDYDVVMMNPPFRRQADIRHVTHALSFLKPGGRLVAVMSAGVTFHQDRRATEFRALLERHKGRIEPLPPQSFRSSGTDVSTVIVTMVA